MPSTASPHEPHILRFDVFTSNLQAVCVAAAKTHELAGRLVNDIQRPPLLRVERGVRESGRDPDGAALHGLDEAMVDDQRCTHRILEPGPRPLALPAEADGVTVDA
jgi:hypothetical protein